MLQNKYILAVVSALLIFACAIYVVQPTSVAYALADVHLLHGKGGIDIFGNIAYENGGSVSGLTVRVGTYNKDGSLSDFFEIDHSETNNEGQYKLWVPNNDIKVLGDNVSLLMQPDRHHSYRRVISLDSTSVAEVSLPLSTQLIPIFPITTFVY